jgi:hypothetical protein
VFLPTLPKRFFLPFRQLSTAQRGLRFRTVIYEIAARQDVVFRLRSALKAPVQKRYE